MGALGMIELLALGLTRDRADLEEIAQVFKTHEHDVSALEIAVDQGARHSYKASPSLQRCYAHGLGMRLYLDQ